MKQLYNKAIYEFDTPIKSYWEEVSHFDQSRFPKLVGDQSCDVCVIGGGFTGISTAYHIAKNYGCLLYTSPSPRDGLLSRMPSSA